MAVYVDRDSLLHIFSLDRWGKYDPGEVRTLIMSVTPEDARPVVMCKHCRYWKHWSNTSHFVCTYVHGAEFVRTADDFCSRGEKRDET